MEIFGLLVLIFDVLAILQIIQGRGSNERKAIWIVLILFLPFVGVVLWYLLGRKK